MTAAQEHPDWRDLLLLQESVLARGQALRSGFSEDAWQWRLDRGSWQSVLPGVAVAHSGLPTERQLAWAAVLYAGPGAALTGLAALRWEGFTLAARAFDVAVPQERVVRAQPSAAWALCRASAGWPPPVVLPHRVSRLPELVRPHALPRRTRGTVALLHAAAWAPSERAAETFVAAAVQQRLVRPAEVRAELAGLPRLPRRRLLLAVLDDVERGAHARGELDLLRLLREERLPLPTRLQQQVSGGRAYLDAWWEEQRVAVEVDGAHHRDVGQWERDLLRTNDLVTVRRQAGVVVLRFTTGQLRHERPEVVRQLRRALLP